MALFGKRQELFRGRPEKALKTRLKTPPRVKPQEGFFGKEGSLTRKRLKWKLWKGPHRVPGYGKRYSRTERLQMEKEIPRGRYGGIMSEQEMKDYLRKLRRSRSLAPYRKKKGEKKLTKEEIKERIRYWQHITGIKRF